MNLWKETVKNLEENGKSFDDVVIICGNDFQITKENFEIVAKQTDYDNGYGGQEVAQDLKIIGNGFVMVRNEYDGSEWWEFIPNEGIPKNIKSIKRLTYPNRSWISLKGIQEIENDR